MNLQIFCSFYMILPPRGRFGALAACFAADTAFGAYEARFGAGAAT